MDSPYKLESTRLFLEEICADLLRFRHAAGAVAGPHGIEIAREVNLGGKDRFADLRVRVPGRPPCYAEIKYGYTAAEVVQKLKRKYGDGSRPDLEKLIVVLRTGDFPDWPSLKAEIESMIRPEGALEIWDESDVLKMIKGFFEVEIDRLDETTRSRLRQAIDQAKWRQAFGPDYEGHGLASTLLWHFNHWSLCELRGRHAVEPEEVLRYGIYPHVAVVMTDLCGFSGYVRDTRDDETIRQSLTAFYSAVRHAIHDSGGMFYQFIGDAGLGLFGVPELVEGYADAALACASALIDIGASVSNRWQSHIDRLQPSSGVRVGIAMGDLNLLPLRPFSRQHLGFISDTINIAARLMSAADPGQIIVSNSCYQRLSLEGKARVVAHQPVEGKNVGTIQCWQVATPVEAASP